MSKPSQKESPFRRRSAFRSLRESFLILCEGENTEPTYFNSFRLSTAHVKALSVTSGDAMAVVKAAIKRRQAEFEKGNEYDHYWVVFDKDATPSDQFNSAIALAESKGFQVAYSNQAFEIWFILHFDYVSGPMHRNQYSDRLKVLLGFPYSKHTDTARLMFRVLLDRQSLAIENAKRLYNQYDNGPDYRNPAEEESSTTVYQLVEKLRSFK
ncbi:RloB family protein [Spirosoma sp.]|uniref:RloB family protein n=1 Tax=Spirosoma sp. TaxID=1899569 RepID=UPI003B3BC7B2